MGLFNLFKASKTVLVIDGVSLNEALGQKGKVAPRNQLQLLRRLARFSQREKLEMVVVLSGSPLHKAPAGKKFEEITVVYSKSAEAHARYLLNAVRSKGAGAMLISGNTAVEAKALSGGLKTMRLSTFRKAFDIGGNEGDSGNERNGNERSNRGGNDRNNRRPRRRQPKQQTNEKAAEKTPPKKSSDADAINELIDLID